ncbi:MAG: hypothetical protein IJT19_07105, partial [Bacteroidaceae bacterium]|nr:hypothetical protein [Bacteroidaceae bacterium]
VPVPAIISQALQPSQAQTRRSVAVRISRSCEGDSLAALIAGLHRKALDGAVIISPFISPGEKALKEVLMSEHLLHVRIDGIGFGPYFKPPGDEIDAVADGYLLLLCPWDYDPRRHLGKREFEELNRIARLLATE